MLYHVALRHDPSLRYLNPYQLATLGSLKANQEKKLRICILKMSIGSGGNGWTFNSYHSAYQLMLIISRYTGGLENSFFRHFHLLWSRSDSHYDVGWMKVTSQHAKKMFFFILFLGQRIQWAVDSRTYFWENVFFWIFANFPGVRNELHIFIGQWHQKLKL